MLDRQLSDSADIHKLASRKATIAGEFSLAAFTRLQDVIAAAQPDATAAIELHFAIDEQGRRCMNGSVAADVEIFCQRCLQAMPWQLAGAINAAAVNSDDEARQLPADMEPVLSDEGIVDLQAFVEDELLLAIPFVAYHEHACAEAAPALKNGSELAPHSQSEARESGSGESSSGDSKAVGDSDSNTNGGTRRPFAGLGEMLEQAQKGK